jgi:hypothetical protein
MTTLSVVLNGRSLSLVDNVAFNRVHLRRVHILAHGASGKIGTLYDATN